MKQGQRALRDVMPKVAMFVDDMREAFGKDMIDAAIRGGMRGEGSFWARENGHEVGSKPLERVERGGVV